LTNLLLSVRWTGEPIVSMHQSLLRFPTHQPTGKDGLGLLLRDGDALNVERIFYSCICLSAESATFGLNVRCCCDTTQPSAVKSLRCRIHWPDTEQQQKRKLSCSTAVSTLRCTCLSNCNMIVGQDVSGFEGH
jgi:hypothetical protein